MNPKAEFLRMYNQLPEKAKRELMIEIYDKESGWMALKSLYVLVEDVLHETLLGKKTLVRLGYKKGESR
jgi:hypothetical protein